MAANQNVNKKDSDKLNKNDNKNSVGVNNKEKLLLDVNVYEKLKGKAEATARSGGDENDEESTAKAEILIANLTEETEKIRLLKGFIYVNEIRNFHEEFMSSSAQKNYDFFLICRRFWYDEITIMPLDKDGLKFQYSEQFSVINDEKFLKCVDRQYLQLEIWCQCYQSTSSDDEKVDTDKDNNGNIEAIHSTVLNTTVTGTETESSLSQHFDGLHNANDLFPIGIIRLPLHQFFIAYRDARMTTHLITKGMLPVISIDNWVPILERPKCFDGGELKCLLAIGSEAQIAHLKETRDFLKTIHFLPSTGNVVTNAMKSNLKLDPRLISKQPITVNEIQPIKRDKLLEKEFKFQSVLGMMETLKPLRLANVKSFTFALGIRRATGLSHNSSIITGGAHGNSYSQSGVIGSGSAGATTTATGTKKKLTRKQLAAAKRLQSMAAPPSAYVTFQADIATNSKSYKSHEGPVFATKIIENSDDPEWKARFRVTVSAEYLLNPQKLFILKVWKKLTPRIDTTTGSKTLKTTVSKTASVSSDSTSSDLIEPTPMKDAIIGFAAINLNVLTKGYHIGGWFDIIDFSGCVNGRIELHCYPVDDIINYLTTTSTATTKSAAAALTVTAPPNLSVDNVVNPQTLLSSPTTLTIDEGDVGVTAAGNASRNNSVDIVIDQFENSLNLSHLNLGQAIKRKISELEQISHRLRTRLVDVTGEALSKEFDYNLLNDWQPLNAESMKNLDGNWNDNGNENGGSNTKRRGNRDPKGNDTRNSYFNADNGSEDYSDLDLDLDEFERDINTTIKDDEDDENLQLINTTITNNTTLSYTTSSTATTTIDTKITAINIHKIYAQNNEKIIANIKKD